MDTEKWLSVLPQFLVLIPTAVSCYYPVKKHMKYSVGKTALLCSSVIIPFAVFGSLAVSVLKIGAGLILLPFIAAAFFLYRKTLNTDLPRSLSVYMGVCTAQSFPAQFAYAFDAFINPTSGALDFSLEAQFFQLGLSCFLSVTAYYPSRKYAAKMIDRMNSAKIWYSTCALSFIFLFANIMATPFSYRTILAGRMYYLFPLFEFFMLAVLMIIYVFFYQAAVIILERAELDKRSQLLEMQSSRLYELREYMKQTQRLRHDFRQSVHILSSLAEEGNLDGVRSHLSEYEQRISRSGYAEFCSNASLDALFRYYYETAEEEGIRTDWKIELPEPLTVSELDMAALFGNIMENAIHACSEQTEGEKYFSLTSELRRGNSLYVVSTNSFNGKALKNGEGGYRSTKHGGQGTGLASVFAVAEKYGGSARAHNSEKEFFVDLVIKI